MRYFIECSYLGTPFQGWQKQPGKTTVQDTLEQKLHILLNQPDVDIVGCGRTDTGVHASKYYAHFDFDGLLDPNLVYHWNAILPAEIAIHHISRVADSAHARFDAVSRTYEYHIHGTKSPFRINNSFFYSRMDKLRLEDLQQAAGLLLQYAAFFPFCLSRSGLKTYAVDIKKVEWKCTAENELIFSITANRFLRGMVRLIVGMCINRAIGQLQETDVIKSLERQELMPKSWSVPAHGLYLIQVEYPYLIRAMETPALIMG